MSESEAPFLSPKMAYKSPFALCFLIFVIPSTCSGVKGLDGGASSSAVFGAFRWRRLGPGLADDGAAAGCVVTKSTYCSMLNQSCLTRSLQGNSDTPKTKPLEMEIAAQTFGQT